MKLNGCWYAIYYPDSETPYAFFSDLILAKHYREICSATSVIIPTQIICPACFEVAVLKNRKIGSIESNHRHWFHWCEKCEVEILGAETKEMNEVDKIDQNLNADMDKKSLDDYDDYYDSPFNGVFQG